MRIILLTLLIISSNLHSQVTYSGQVLDKNSKIPLPYVNIGVVNKNKGTVSNDQGDFQIDLDNAFDNDTLKISMIGYSPIRYKVSDFKELIRKNPILQLQEENTALEEVVISSRKLKEKILGNKTTSKSMSGGFTSDDLGNEIGIKIKIKHRPTFIENFNVSIVKNEYDTMRFRLNFYDIKDGWPNTSLLRENIIIESNIKEGVLTVDLKEYDIVVYDDFIVTLEWIENLGDKNGIAFSAGFLGSPIIVRTTSQGEWKKIGAISIGFNLTVKQ